MDHQDNQPLDNQPKMGTLTQNVLVTCIVMSIISLVGIIGNSLMLRAYIKYEKLRTNFYTVFCTLSIADSIFLLVSAPTYIMDSTIITEGAGRDPQLQVAWCKFSNYLMDACNFTSSYLLVVLAVLRAILLTSRNVRHQPKPWHLVILSGIIYVVAFAASVPIINTITSFEGQCQLNLDISVSANQRDEWLKSLFSVFLPLGMMVIVHFVAHKLSKRYFSDSYSPREKEKSRLVITIIGAFTVCQLPYRVVNLYFKHNFMFHESEVDWEVYDRYEVLKSYMVCLWTLDKAIRPILYSKLASDLCEAFDEVINCTYCSRAYFQEPLYDRPVSRIVNADEADQINGQATTDDAQYVEATGMESQTILTENVEIHNFDGYDDYRDEGYDESNSSSSRNSGGEEKACDNDRSSNRLVSTSSSASAASATSQTPLVNRRDQDNVV